MVAHDKNSRGIANDTKQEVIGKALQVHAAKIALAKSEGFRSLRSLLQIISPARRKIRRRVAASQPAHSNS
jgi:hypothetical protein